MKSRPGRGRSARRPAPTTCSWRSYSPRYRCGASRRRECRGWVPGRALVEGWPSHRPAKAFLAAGRRIPRGVAGLDKGGWPGRKERSPTARLLFWATSGYQPQDDCLGVDVDEPLMDTRIVQHSPPLRLATLVTTGTLWSGLRPHGDRTDALSPRSLAAPSSASAGAVLTTRFCPRDSAHQGPSGELPGPVRCDVFPSPGKTDVPLRPLSEGDVP